MMMKLNWDINKNIKGVDLDSEVVQVVNFYGFCFQI